jgi:trehalose 6-phosphate synthase
LARLIIVSNRVGVPTKGGGRAGGLESAVRTVLKTHPGLWFGWSGRVQSGRRTVTRTIETGGIPYVVTDLNRKSFNEYYYGFANRVLWPILHYRLDLAEYTRRDLTGYLEVNEHFAKELKRIVKPDDIVWVHDYHLIPLARALRERGLKNPIGFFLHTPLPPPEILTAVPNHEQVLSAITCYDLAGFQTKIDTANFGRYLREECGATALDQRTFRVGERLLRIDTFPVGVDAAELGRLSERAVRSAFVRRFMDSLNGRSMLIGVDRLDYSKGIVARLEGFDRFLNDNPDWRRRVTYLQITPKSRSRIREYSEMEAEVSGLVGRINGAYADVAWAPIRYVNRVYSQFALAGLYRSARVGLVTPLRDGMNLVAKEFVASQDPDDPGILVLSRFAGAATECQTAILVNPYDTEALAGAIARALAMSRQERRERHAAMHRTIMKNDLTTWGDRFLKGLAVAAEEPVRRKGAA